ncbi:hypothetical protein HNO86_17750 [Pseudomonas sp. C1C7]|uniref:hypothetical protein n=1 Tax=Pseudomonas sp. C1C7 TaxID=2735272 RepID=UPI0015860C24|nr:hypothetical protein [Pseudomonas sp. C1C7]NUT76887.1 hypothetical protein [Pseudomonas sp. C1C7]
MRLATLGLLIAPLLNVVACAEAAETATFAKEREAMEIIKDYAAFACGNVSHTGVNESVEVSASAKAELKGLVKKLADLGASGAVKYQKAEYQGVLQEDLAKALSAEGNCKLEVLKTMQNKLLPSPPPSIPPTRKPSALKSFYNDIMLGAFKGKKSFEIGITYSEFSNLYKKGPDWEEHEGVDDNKVLIYSGESEGVNFGYQFIFTKNTKRLWYFMANLGASTPPEKELKKQPDFMKRRELMDLVKDICNTQQTLLMRFSRELGDPPYTTRAMYGVSDQSNAYPEYKTDISPDRYSYESSRVYLFAPASRGWIGAEWNIEKTSNDKLAETEENLFRPIGNGLSCLLNLTVGENTTEGIDHFNYSSNHLQYRRSHYKDFSR